MDAHKVARYDACLKARGGSISHGKESASEQGKLQKLLLPVVCFVSHPCNLVCCFFRADANRRKVGCLGECWLSVPVG